jgi:GT2 family glycosyltransferase
MQHEPSVGVVVVNYNGGDRVLRVLAALREQRHPLGEIVVVDNASTDGSVERIRHAFPRVRIVDLETNTGLSIARNIGLRELRTPLALLLDHDVYVDGDCIEKMVDAYRQRHLTVVCPRIRLIPERELVQVDGAALHFLGTLILRHAYQRVDRTPAVAGYADGCIGACMLMHRERVIEAGGFDELFFFYLEDMEFSMRLRAAGHRFWCETSAEAFHERAAGTPNLSFRGSGSYPPRRAYFTMRNRLLSMLIHYRLRTLLTLLPVLVLYELASFVVACKKGWPWQWFRAWGWQLTNLGTIAARRRRMQGARSVDDRDLLVGGPPPLAPGFLDSALEKRLYSWFSKVVEGYWALVRRWIG